MLTVAQAFEQFMQNLELHAGEDREAKRQERNVFDAVRRHLGPRESILSGSYGRSTAIRPLHDIDLFLIFTAAASGTGEAVGPEAFLKRVKQALEQEFPGKQARLQNRSVNIEFSGTGIGFDVVPALEDPRRQGIYWIPDVRKGDWIQSNPRKHLEACDAANARVTHRLKPLIKALKRWNQLQGKPVPSFLLEVMAYKGIDSFQSDERLSVYAQGLAHLFQFMSGHILDQWPEPAGLGPPVNSGVGQTNLLQGQQRISGAARRAAQALELERVGNMAGANALWRELLGTDYPGR
ncbi:nucleotidyltransferase [Vitiosangium sp. GDMCC 1.1324]|uniref:nucleotidyltransferase domain-containing protein n=1 Tax=Vitiosangium sp. (strain GDMCC 1.1324) TaxID=2138576 RepID=UPI000D36F258|nr:nucleotidyltransferase [Vitiosangium sp. GDMCC 1.1324]PTL75395.1 nucleotidyltransferase [Vitiosangium sp. GDMCC 1.1324]